jgi:hypothetical protein
LRSLSPRRRLIAARLLAHLHERGGKLILSAGVHESACRTIRAHGRDVDLAGDDLAAAELVEQRILADGLVVLELLPAAGGTP